MGMTIEKIIKTLLWFEDYNEDTYCGGDRIQDEYGEWFYKVTEEDFEAFRQAADIMRKYQKLEQEPQTFKWCDTCKEYDQEKHCCHRWSKVIRDTVDEMKQEQEPILDKIRAEIDNALSDGMVHKKTVLGIIDKYKAESEDT